SIALKFAFCPNAVIRSPPVHTAYEVRPTPTMGSTARATLEPTKHHSATDPTRSRASRLTLAQQTRTASTSTRKKWRTSARMTQPCTRVDTARTHRKTPKKTSGPGRAPEQARRASGLVKRNSAAVIAGTAQPPTVGFGSPKL